MGQRADRKIALMSIRPEFADGILRGDKRVEFRKSRFAAAVSHVLVYATDPVKMIVGFFEVESLDSDAPSKLWKRYSDVSGIDQKRFDEYFFGRDLGHAIRIGRVHRFVTPIEIDRVVETETPPQSFRYVGSDVLDEVSECVVGSVH